MKLSTFSLALMAGLFAHASVAGTLSLGAGVLVTPSPYKSGQDRVYPAPIINYDSDSFYVHSLTAGYYLWNDDSNKLSAMVFYSPLHYDPSDSDSLAMKSLDKRRSTLMAGIAYQHEEEWGKIRAALAGDTLNNSNGATADLAYLYTFHVGDFSVTPGLGVNWSSENQNQYYYGISRAESLRSGLSKYDADESWSPYVELAANYSINKEWNAFFSGRYTRLDSEVKDSPMVDKSYAGMLISGVTYTF